MEALECLTAEHELIKLYIAHIAAAATEMKRGKRPPAEFFEQVVILAKQFVDTYHHDKEERQMFTLLAQKHAGAFDDRLEAISYQHERGREYVANILGAIDGYRAGQSGTAHLIIENLEAFASMLTEHIRREDDEFFPIVKRTLTDDEAEQLLVEFGRADERAGVGFFEQSRERVDKMGKLLQV